MSSASAVSAANRLGIDYRRVPPRRVNGPITDVHTHVRGVKDARLYLDVARQYGVTRIVSMTPLVEVDAMRAAYGDALSFIAVPDWNKQAVTEEFQRGWMRDLETFRGKGARICKFWMAPRMREKHGLTLDHPFMRAIVRHAHGLGYHFMTHIGDPSAWWETQYKDVAKFGTKREQFTQLEWLLSEFPDRTVIGAHMGGSVEELDFLDGLLERFPNYVLDSSATKWIVRGVASQPEAVRAFMIRRQDRVLFGSDVVVGEKYEFDHYASRYWCHQMMWETAYRGESPIEDPDAGASPRLAGVDLPAEVLEKVYWRNYDRLFG